MVTQKRTTQQPSVQQIIRSTSEALEALYLLLRRAQLTARVARFISRPQMDLSQPLRLAGKLAKTKQKPSGQNSAI